jgi:hypothetical protein
MINLGGHYSPTQIEAESNQMKLGHGSSWIKWGIPWRHSKGMGISLFTAANSRLSWLRLLQIFGHTKSFTTDPSTEPSRNLRIG